MRTQIVLATTLAILGGAVFTPNCEAGPIRKVIMMKKVQKKQEQKDEQSKSGGDATKTSTKSSTSKTTESTTTTK